MEDFESHVRAVFPAICVANGVFESDDTMGEIESNTFFLLFRLRTCVSTDSIFTGCLRMYGPGDMANNNSTAAIVGPHSQISVSSLPPDGNSESIQHDASILSSSAT
ncbi:hypothetical protein QCA50_020342 [Cerrena zonata]|uniref:Uncharacterized protein n=1 Tax=Cerrena zonata TaxID=2478898 RepID=A0AAW0F7X3_9APHY